MKSLLLTAMITLLPTTVFAVDNQSKFDAYRQRLAAKRAYALDARREYNARRGPHVYHTAIAVPAPITPFIAIEKGWVRQPAIPIRPIYGRPIVPPVFHSGDRVYSHPVESVSFARLRR